ncbi:MAG: hypothetical protein DRJ31_02130 [Candidatus Methanomethylicota archaeon]|uniref:Uncharacterized protein n=1 Tax=Thermoproteota archaeon TaxID=2056631 RepID=A0A497EU47_9CREN|nr:MAG: hypothetical protein DRJ31_02130 [Candidatus Verstraetearchaeota archaeon]RLE51422.1 MAG: hypothetical protein DRJ33_05960 [Candidatus Verstraetearchaeota archaeon]
MFSRYAALVKNLRGVVLISPGEDVEDLVNWLVNRFKYRNLGVTPTILSRASGYFEKRLGGKPFVQVVYPIKPIQELVNVIVDSLNVDMEAAEAVVLASSYVSPIIALGREAEKMLKPLTIEDVKSKVKLDNPGWRLHLRIADYTVLDLYSWSVDHALNMWKEFSSRSFVEERMKRIKADKKRYWRLEKGDLEPWTFLYYVDLAQLIALKDLFNRVAKLGEDVAAGLAIEAAVSIKRENIPV